MMTYARQSFPPAQQPDVTVPNPKHARLIRSEGAGRPPRPRAVAGMIIGATAALAAARN